MTSKGRMATIALVSLFLATTATARTASIHRGLRRMVGFTIISSDSVDEVIESTKGNKCVKLFSGVVFRIDLSILDPLPASDVIVFGTLPESRMSRALLKFDRSGGGSSAFYAAASASSSGARSLRASASTRRSR